MRFPGRAMVCLTAAAGLARALPLSSYELENHSGDFYPSNVDFLNRPGYNPDGVPHVHSRRDATGDFQQQKLILQAQLQAIVSNPELAAEVEEQILNMLVEQQLVADQQLQPPTSPLQGQQPPPPPAPVPAPATPPTQSQQSQAPPHSKRDINSDFQQKYLALQQQLAAVAHDPNQAQQVQQQMQALMVEHQAALAHQPPAAEPSAVSSAAEQAPTDQAPPTRRQAPLPPGIEEQVKQQQAMDAAAAKQNAMWQAKADRESPGAGVRSYVVYPGRVPGQAPGGPITIGP